MKSYKTDDTVQYERYSAVYRKWEQNDQKARKGIGFLLFDSILNYLIEKSIL